MKILIIRLSAIGDTIHCLPVADAIKRRFPGCEVGWLVEPASAPLLINNPAIDKVFTLPRKQWQKLAASPWKWPGLATDIGAFWSGIRQEKYDVALEMQGLLKSSICAVASGARRRFGFAGTREGAEQLLTDRYDAGNYFAIDRHVVELNLSIVDYLVAKLAGNGTVPQMVPLPARITFPLPEPPAQSVENVERWLAQSLSDAPDKSMVSDVVLIPGTTWPSKIWPAERWCRLAEELATKLGFRVSLTGGAAESTINGEIAASFAKRCPESQIRNLTGKTSLVDLIALYRRARLVIGADTGPLHLAAAVGKPRVLGIYGSSPWLRNGPYGQNCRTVHLELSCQPCYSKNCPLGTNACLNELSVEQVFQSAQELLQQ